jgi:dGTPase
VELFAVHARAARRLYPELGRRRLLFEAVRRMLSAQVYEVIGATGAALDEHRPASADDARRLPALVRFGEPAHRAGVELKRFLRDNLYRHPQVVDTTERAKSVIRDLFEAYLAQPAEMQAAFSARPDRVRAITDYVAGMTDRFALKEHHRLTGRQLF